MKRKSEIKRKTAETDIKLALGIDGKGKSSISTGIAFFDHMLTLFSKHGYFDLNVKAKGDLAVDMHHTVEDAGIVLGQAFRKALGACKGIKRYGASCLTMDESISKATIDIGGRPNLVFNVPKKAIGEKDFDIKLTKAFLKAFCDNAKVTLHINLPYGEDIHHINEVIFKSFARALSNACEVSRRAKGVPSTKGKI